MFIDEHVKEGQKDSSRRYHGTFLTVSDLGVSSADIGSYGASSARFFYLQQKRTTIRRKLAENPSNASVSNDMQSTTIEFSLIEGNATTVILVKK